MKIYILPGRYAWMFVVTVGVFFILPPYHSLNTTKQIGLIIYTALLLYFMLYTIKVLLLAKLPLMILSDHDLKIRKPNRKTYWIATYPEISKVEKRRLRGGLTSLIFYKSSGERFFFLTYRISVNENEILKNIHSRGVTFGGDYSSFDTYP